MAKSKIAKRRRRRNPLVKEATALATTIGAGVAGYASVRLLSRIAFAQSVKRWPDAAKHAHVASSALAAVGVYFGSKHWEKIEEYHEAATIGAGIALFQTAIQTYLPQFGWVVADVDTAQYQAKGKRPVELPHADLTELLLADPHYDPYRDQQAPQQQQALPPQDDFDLETMLTENPDIEAVEIGRMEPMPAPQGSDQGDDLGDLLSFNGMMH